MTKEDVHLIFHWAGVPEQFAELYWSEKKIPSVIGDQLKAVQRAAFDIRAALQRKADATNIDPSYLIHLEELNYRGGYVPPPIPKGEEETDQHPSKEWVVDQYDIIAKRIGEIRLWCHHADSFWAFMRMKNWTINGHALDREDILNQMEMHAAEERRKSAEWAVYHKSKPLINTAANTKPWHLT